MRLHRYTQEIFAEQMIISKAIWPLCPHLPSLSLAQIRIRGKIRRKSESENVAGAEFAVARAWGAQSPAFTSALLRFLQSTSSPFCSTLLSSSSQSPIEIQSSWSISFKARQEKTDGGEGDDDVVGKEEVEELVWERRLICSSPLPQVARQLHSEKRATMHWTFYIKEYKRLFLVDHLVLCL